MALFVPVRNAVGIVISGIFLGLGFATKLNIFFTFTLFFVAVVDVYLQSRSAVRELRQLIVSYGKIAFVCSHWCYGVFSFLAAALPRPGFAVNSIHPISCTPCTLSCRLFRHAALLATLSGASALCDDVDFLFLL